MGTVNNRRHHDTSIAGWSFAIARALDEYGVDSAAVFARAGIDLSEVQFPDERLPVSCVQQVWRWAADNTDECFGIRVAQQINPASLHALGYALWSSSTMIEELFRRSHRNRIRRVYYLLRSRNTASPSAARQP